MKAGAGARRAPLPRGAQPLLLLPLPPPPPPSPRQRLVSSSPKLRALFERGGAPILRPRAAGEMPPPPGQLRRRGRQRQFQSRRKGKDALWRRKSMHARRTIRTAMTGFGSNRQTFLSIRKKEMKCWQSMKRKREPRLSAPTRGGMRMTTAAADAAAEPPLPPRPRK